MTLLLFKTFSSLKLWPIFVSPTFCLCTERKNFSWVRRFFANIPTNFDLTKKKLNNQTDANFQICKSALHNVSYSELQCNSNKTVNWIDLEPSMY